MASSLKTIMLLLVFAIIGGGAYFAINTLNLLDTRGPLVEYEASVGDLERTVISRVNQLNRIQFDVSIFSRSEYRSLKDLRIDLPAPVVSRTDPFAGL